MTFRLHPLHSADRHVQVMLEKGVIGYHSWLEAKRATGRTTAQALRAIADAIDKPFVSVDLVDHSGLRAGHENLAATARALIKDLGLLHLTLNRGKNPHGAVQAITFGA